MTEHLHTPEHNKDSHEFENTDTEKLEKKSESSAEQAAKTKESELNIDKIRELVKKEEAETKTPKAEITNDEPKSLPPPNAELRRITLHNTMGRIRRQLPKRQVALSKFIHQPTVDKISEFSGKTVVRPSGFLFGAFFGLIGSSFVLYLSRHYDFKYNYTTFFVFFIGGFLLGLIIELIYRYIKILSSTKTKNN